MSPVQCSVIFDHTVHPVYFFYIISMEQLHLADPKAEQMKGNHPVLRPNSSRICVHNTSVYFATHIHPHTLTHHPHHTSTHQHFSMLRKIPGASIIIKPVQCMCCMQPNNTTAVAVAAKRFRVYFELKSICNSCNALDCGNRYMINMCLYACE